MQGQRQTELNHQRPWQKGWGSEKQIRDSGSKESDGERGRRSGKGGGRFGRGKRGKKECGRKKLRGRGRERERERGDEMMLKEPGLNSKAALERREAYHRVQ